jgi:hypothetical protein
MVGDRGALVNPKWSKVQKEPAAGNQPHHALAVNAATCSGYSPVRHTSV